MELAGVGKLLFVESPPVSGLVLVWTRASAAGSECHGVSEEIQTDGEERNAEEKTSTPAVWFTVLRADQGGVSRESIRFTRNNITSNTTLLFFFKLQLSTWSSFTQQNL